MVYIRSVTNISTSKYSCIWKALGHVIACKLNLDAVFPIRFTCPTNRFILTNSNRIFWWTAHASWSTEMLQYLQIPPDSLPLCTRPSFPLHTWPDAPTTSSSEIQAPMLQPVNKLVVTELIIWINKSREVHDYGWWQRVNWKWIRHWTGHKGNKLKLIFGNNKSYFNGPTNDYEYKTVLN